jgi:hypothetical protein
LPHVWLEDATPIKDRMSNLGYTLLCLNGRHDTASLEQAFRAGSVPFRVLQIASGAARAIYERESDFDSPRHARRLARQYPHPRRIPLNWRR